MYYTRQEHCITLSVCRRHQWLFLQPLMTAVVCYLRVCETPEVGREVVLDAVRRPRQCDAADKEDEQDDVGKEGCEPHHL